MQQKPDLMLVVSVIRLWENTRLDCSCTDYANLPFHWEKEKSPRHSDAFGQIGMTMPGLSR